MDHARYRDLFDKVVEEEFGLDKPKSDWDKMKLSKSLPIDIFFKLYPITATWTIRKRYHNI